MSDRRTSAEMIGEGLRELGILMLVFVPLDFAIADRPPLTGWGVSAIVALALALFVIGVRIERTRM
jgi:hypothetical protein